LAFTKEEKRKLVAQYADWLKESKAVYLVEYSQMNMKALEELRDKARDIGAELHVTKNTLLKLAMEQAKYDKVKLQEGTTMCALAFEDAPALAKIISDTAKDKKESFVVKSGYLNGQFITADQVTALADLPPLPVMRAMLLGTILAPASKLVRTLAEPGRSVAAVIKAFADKEPVPA
jgi:large subunit ribosomal protein L10